MSRAGRRSLLLMLVLGGVVSFAPGVHSGGDPFQDPMQKGKKPDRTSGYEEPVAAGRPASKQLRFVEAWRFPLGSPLSGPILSLDSNIVVSVEIGIVQAISLPGGQPLWKTDLGERLSGGPAGFAGRVVQAAASGKVTGLDPVSGAEVWSTRLGGEIQPGLTATNGGLFVPLSSGQVVSLKGDGTERWRVHLRGSPSTPVEACRGFISVGTDAGTVEAYDRETGRQLWVFEAGSPVRSPLLCYRGLIYFGTHDYRFNAIRYSGRRKWSYKVGGDITARPFGTGRRVYFLCFDNYVYALRARSGHLLLKVGLSHRLSQDAFRASDLLYLSPYTSARLLALALPDLGMSGEYRLDLEGEWFTTPPVRAQDQVLIGYGRYEGRILALREVVQAPQAGG